MLSKRFVQLSKLTNFAACLRSRSSMDRISDSGSDDMGSNPVGITGLDADTPCRSFSAGRIGFVVVLNAKEKRLITF